MTSGTTEEVSKQPELLSRTGLQLSVGVHHMSLPQPEVVM